VRVINKNYNKDENAYITIFIAHHTKSNYILDELLLNAEILFEKYRPATLSTEELSFFDSHEEDIVKAILPSYEHNANEERNKLLNHKSEVEEIQQEKSEVQYSETDERESELIRNLRLSIKTVEVMGLVIKNRSGSLDLKRLEYIFEQRLNVNLRVITSFLELIQNEPPEYRAPCYRFLSLWILKWYQTGSPSHPYKHNNCAYRSNPMECI